MAKKPTTKTHTPKRLTVDARRTVTPYEVRRLLRPLELEPGDVVEVSITGRAPGSTRYERAVAIVTRYVEMAGAKIGTVGQADEAESPGD